MNLNAWYVNGNAYMYIDDAVKAVVSLIGERELAIYGSEHVNANVMLSKEARAVLLDMAEGDVHDFMGVLITIENIPFEV
jgi:hypothetical protein